MHTSFTGPPLGVHCCTHPEHYQTTYHLFGTMFKGRIFPTFCTIIYIYIHTYIHTHSIYYIYYTHIQIYTYINIYIYISLHLFDEYYLLNTFCAKNGIYLSQLYWDVDIYRFNTQSITKHAHTDTHITKWQVRVYSASLSVVLLDVTHYPNHNLMITLVGLGEYNQKEKHHIFFTLFIFSKCIFGNTLQ